MVALRLSAACGRRSGACPGTRAGTPDAVLPVYSVIVALHRERPCRAQARRGAERARLSGREARHQARHRGDDVTTPEALERSSCRPLRSSSAPPGEPRTKPRALNVALAAGARRVHGRLRRRGRARPGPAPSRGRRFAGCRRRSPACRRGSRSTTPTTPGSPGSSRSNMPALFDVINPALAAPRHCRSRSAAPRTISGPRFCKTSAAGTPGTSRRTPISASGSPASATGSPTCPPRHRRGGAADARRWMSQRTRWMKGFMQTCVDPFAPAARRLAAAGPVRFWAAVTLTFGTVLSALGYPMFIGLSPSGPSAKARSMRQATLAHVGGARHRRCSSLGLVAIFVPALRRPASARLGRLLPCVPLLPLYYVLVSVAAWRGSASLLRDPFRWNKTEHGLARTSRAGQGQTWRRQSCAASSGGRLRLNVPIEAAVLVHEVDERRVLHGVVAVLRSAPCGRRPGRR